MKKYEWLASESAPKKYPMEIVAGNFICSDGYSLYIPNRKFIHLGWGRAVSTHVVGPERKSLPHKVAITWFSYTENKFYAAEFDLPYDKILGLFQQGHIKRDTEIKADYMEIIAGVAPGGYVSVWVAGVGDVRHICSSKGKEIDLPWTSITNNPNFIREPFVESQVKRVWGEEGYQELKAKGIPFGRWAEYDKYYTWEPEFHHQGRVKSIYYSFYNGEQRFVDYNSPHPLNVAKLNAKERPIPKQINFDWETETGSQYSTEVNFTEQEILKAFNKLKELDGVAQQLKMRVEISTIDRSTRIYLRNSKYILELKELDVDLFRFK